QSVSPRLYRPARRIPVVPRPGALWALCARTGGGPRDAKLGKRRACARGGAGSSVPGGGVLRLTRSLARCEHAHMGQAPMTGSSEPLVSVVVPANNEAATVPAFVEKTAKAFADMGRPWELVYVDDGSSDGTAA